MVRFINKLLFTWRLEGALKLAKNDIHRYRP